MIQFEYSSLDLSIKKDNLLMSSVFGEDIFFYGVYDSITKRLLASKCHTGLPEAYYLDESYLKQLLDDAYLQDKIFDSLSIGFSTEFFSLVPRNLKIDDVASFAETFTGQYYDDRFELRKQQLDLIDSDLYYMFPKVLENLASNISPHIHICHLNGSLIQGVKERNGSFVFYNLLNRKMQTVVVKNGELIQTNDYFLIGKDDALYYALLNCEQFDFDPATSSFYISGLLLEPSEQLELFQQHFNYLDILANNNRLEYSNVFLGKSKHLFFDLECVLKCES